MGILAKLRAGTPAPYDEFWYTTPEGFALARGGAGSDTAMRLSAVYSCVRVVSEDVAKLPLIVYRRLPNGGKERAPEHPLYKVLHDWPNVWQSSFDFRQMMQRSLELRGNALALIRGGLGGPVEQLILLDPDRLVEIRQDGYGTLSYVFNWPDGKPKTLWQEEVFHVRGFSRDGITGLGTIQEQRDAVGLGLAAQEFHSSYFRHGARPSGALVHPAPKAPDKSARDKFRERIRQEFAGKENAGKLMVLWEDMKFIPFTMTMEDAQFIEARKFSRGEIAAIFRVPPHKIGDLERATFSNIEHQSIEYVIDGLMGRLIRWEQAIQASLFRGFEDLNDGEYFAEFLIDGLLRGDLLSRYQAYAIGRRGKWLSANDVRRLENMNPIEGGDEYENPDITTNAAEPGPDRGVAEP